MKKNSIRMRISDNKNFEQVFKTLITHPMETGYRRDRRTGLKVPADYIENFRISIDGTLYFEMILGESVSKNPFISFVFTKPLVDNQVMRVSWIDNNKIEVFYDCTIKLSLLGSYAFEGTN